MSSALKQWKAYFEYKDSGSPLLGKIPKNWSVYRLRTICGINPSKSEVAQVPDDFEVSFLPMEKIGDDGTLILDETRPIQVVRQGFTYFQERDVIIAKITPCFENGKGALCRNLVGGFGFGTTELHVLRPTQVAVPEFIYYVTRTPLFRELGIASMTGAAGQQRVPETFVADFPVALPPSAEQQAIARFLDYEIGKINSLIAKNEYLLELLAEKRQSLITHAVTQGIDPSSPMRDSGLARFGYTPEHWMHTRMQYISTLKGRLGWQGLKAEEYVDEGPYIVSSEQFYKYRIRWEKCPHVTQERYDLDANIQLAPHDILLMKDGAALGKLAYVDSLPNKACLNSHLLLFRPKDRQYVPRFLFFLLASTVFQHYIKVTATGTTFLGISQSSIGDFQLVLPPIAEQNEIVEFLLATRHLPTTGMKGRQRAKKRRE